MQRWLLCWPLQPPSSRTRELNRRTSTTQQSVRLSPQCGCGWAWLCSIPSHVYMCMPVCFCRSTNLIEMAKAVRMLAALTPIEADKENLLDAARCVATACAKLLEATEPNQLEVGVRLSCFLPLYRFCPLTAFSYRFAVPIFWGLRIVRCYLPPREKWGPRGAPC